MHRKPLRHDRPRGNRSRCSAGPGRWTVRARVERFVEPALLLLLRERPTHGYELLERLPELSGDGRVDMGNLYRVLRSLEEEGVVASAWDGSRRSYELTDTGRRLLDEWAEALRGTRTRIESFLERYERR